MKSNFLLFFTMMSLQVLAQSNLDETLKFPLMVDSLYSQSLEAHRMIKIYLPKDYQKDKKYPVIYTLDASWMLEPTLMSTKMLMDFDVIPKSIVVGVFHKDRNIDLGIDWQTGDFDKNGSKFYTFLTNELLPSVNETYATSGFNVLIGHSNSATFCQEVMTHPEQVFNGFIALSQNLFGNQLEKYAAFTQMDLKHPTFYFVASGKRDATPRLETGMQLDSLFNINSNPDLFPNHVVYDADHSGIVGHGITAGITHVFSKYKHFNDWNDQLIDSLLTKQVSSFDFMDQHGREMKRLYGINFKPNRDDLSLMQAMTQNEADIKAIQEFEIKLFGKSEQFYAAYAQYYEYAKSYENALDYWNQHLEQNKTQDLHFFYLRRPIQLLYKKMDQPKRAIKLIEKWRVEHPNFSQAFNYWTAKIAVESNTEKGKGLEAIRNYIKNYAEDAPISLEQAKELEQQLTN